jgi:hypothetical protein
VRIELHVERLVLDGVDLPPQGARPFRAAFSSELERLFATGDVSGLLRSGSALDSLAGAPVQTGMKPTAIGISIARAVHREVAR